MKGAVQDAAGKIGPGWDWTVQGKIWVFICDKKEMLMDSEQKQLP